MGDTPPTLIKSTSATKIKMRLHGKFTKREMFWAAMLCLIWLVCTAPFIIISGQKAESTIYTELQYSLDKLNKKLDEHVTSYRLIQSSIARLPIAKEILINPNGDLIDRANRFLRLTNNRMKSDVIYILDLDGTVIASSNYASERSFIGENFSFRPYFIYAVNDVHSEYSATGVVTKQRGYFFSSPIKQGDKVVGVAVVNILLEHLFDELKLISHEYLLAGIDGVIFSSSESTWNYKTLYPLTEKSRQMIKEARRYGLHNLTSISEHTAEEMFTQNKLSLRVKEAKRDYFVKRKSIKDTDWYVYALTPQTSLIPPVLMTFLFSSLLFWLIILIWLYSRKRNEIQRHVESLNIILEKKIVELTGGLQKSNDELKELVTHYKDTQDELVQTQDQLVRSAKLATLGEMSASMNHELNQPLSALQIYIENCLKMQARDNYKIVGANLQEMNTIIKIMTKIVSSFKVFARNTPPQPQNCSLHEVVNSALVIVEHRIKKYQIKLTVDYGADKVAAYCEPVQLGQVLVNLLSNAIDALSTTADGEIYIHVKNSTEHAIITVNDNGSGLNKDTISQIFEPFFTTKTQGLGLGLAISKRIIEAQGGHLTASAHKNSGTSFKIELHKSKIGKIASFESET
jgi:two-component system C4-dicarboxylate transport sensor histidine kinase DctB